MIERTRLRTAVKARRWLGQKRVERAAGEILSTLDRYEFDRRFRDDPALQARGGHGSSKFVHLDRWIRENVDRYYRYGFGAMPKGSKVLDLGCGSGFFLLVSQYFGHSALGVDMDVDPLYTEQIEFFGLDRVLHRIEPGNYLPPLDRPFDLVTGFMVGFNRFEDGSTWDTTTWLEFFDALRAIMKPKGRALFWFNRFNGEYYPDALPDAMAGLGVYRVRFFSNCLDLRAR